MLTGQQEETSGDSPHGQALAFGSASTALETTQIGAATGRGFDRRALVIQASLVWLATRVAYCIYTYFAMLYSSGNRTLSLTPMPPNALLHAWQHWDAHWYLRIALRGYFSPEPTAFFPLYPALISGLTHIVGPTHELAAAMLISNLGALGAFIAMALLAAHEMGERAAFPMLRIFIAFPLAFFTFAAYTEGLFIAFAAASLYCMRRGSWRWASFWAFLAALTRPTGLVLILPLAWEYARQHDWWRILRARDGSWRSLVAPRALGETAMVIGAVPFGIGLYALYLWHLFGSPTVFLSAEKLYWAHVPMAPWDALFIQLKNFYHVPAFTSYQALLLIDLVPVLALGILTVVAIRRMPVAFTLFSLGVLYLCLASPIISRSKDILISDGRYVMVAVPMFLLLTQWSQRRPWLETLLVMGGLLVQAILALVYLHNGLVR